MLTFFGLPTSHRLSVFHEIHEIVFHSNGGYDWGTVYNMPLWLRKYTFNKMKEWFDKQNKEEDLNDATNNRAEIYKPAVIPKQPTYTVPASKK